MAQSQIQEQRLAEQQRLTQSITQQQLLQSQLTELPVTQLVERIQAEMDDNPALEPSTDEGDTFSENVEYTEQSENADAYEQEERQSALDEALQSLGRDDEDLPVYQGGMSNQEERESMVYGQSLSFYDQLKEQMGMINLTEQQQSIMEYLIGSLDDDGLLRKPLHAIADELAIYHGVDVNEEQIEQVLTMLQDFDPAGIGARSLQECLLLQVKRREPSRLKELMERVLNKYFELFTKKHWKQLQQALRLTDLQAETLISELRKLNPKPGTSMGEVVGHSIQQITPDFIIDTLDDGTVSFQLNTGDIPELHVSPSFTETLEEYQHNKDNMSRQMKEALLYTKKKVDARGHPPAPPYADHRYASHHPMAAPLFRGRRRGIATTDDSEGHLRADGFGSEHRVARIQFQICTDPLGNIPPALFL